MKCLICEATIREDSNFCTECGTAVLRCPSCHHPVLADAHFCGHCGENLQHHVGLHEESDVVLERVTAPVVRTRRAAQFSQEISMSELAILYRPTRISQRYPLMAGDNTIGANPRNDVVIGDQEISWNHCLIICRPDRILIQDTASTNGTYVNNVQVVRPTKITSKDKLRISSIDFQIWVPGDYEARHARNHDG